MQKIAIGEPYSPTRTRWPDHLAQYNYRLGHHDLVIFYPDLKEHEILGVRKGKMEVAIATMGPAIYFLFQFGTVPESPYKVIPCSEAIYSCWLLPQEQREAQETLDGLNPGPNQRFPLQVILVDSVTGIVKTFRFITLPVDVTQYLAKAIRAQMATPWVGSAAYDANIADVNRRHPDGLSVVRKEAAVRGRAGEPGE